MHKGLILVADDIEQFDFLLDDLPEIWLQRLAGSWPGPNTWLVPHQNRLPEWVTGEHDTVALRVSDHPLVCALCRYTGPLISTSANPAGRPSARSRLRVEQYFPGELDKVLGGALGGRRNPSLIRDLRTGDVIRPSWSYARLARLRSPAAIRGRDWPRIAAGLRALKATKWSSRWFALSSAHPARRRRPSGRSGC